jgi:acetylornithine deacetylase/succinyl-diaminopimelate desuccinylase-like protein
MPELLADLERLVGIPSVAFPGYPPEPVHQMANEALQLFREAGFADVALQQVPTG